MPETFGIASWIQKWMENRDTGFNVENSLGPKIAGARRWSSVPHYISEWVCKFMENIRFLFWTSHEEGSSLCRAGGPKGMRSCLPSKSNFILLYCLTCWQWKVTQLCTENEGDKSHRTYQVGKIRDQESSIPLCLSSYTGSIFFISKTNIYYFFFGWANNWWC
jgi:hypothetical protein